MNRLKNSSSAYLRQHAQDPVHWWPWGQEAFDHAAATGKPVLISIGYAACHWCHVMAGETFRDFAIAQALNEHCVCIKVDREEHPQVDERYMSACQLMTGHGGWPLTIFAFPDGVPFYAGTYFPAQDRPGQPGFATVVETVHRLYSENQQQLRQAADKVAEALRAESNYGQKILCTALPEGSIAELFTTAEKAQEFAAAVIASARVLTQRWANPQHSSAQQSAQFPPHALWEALNAVAASPSVTTTHRQQAQELSLELASSMAASALQDHLYGGFFRYTVDATMLLPHFEKMLQDNALILQQLATLLAGLPAEDTPQQKLCWATAQRLADWLLGSLRLADSGFGSSLDADSEVAGYPVEGGLYLLTENQWTQAASEANVADQVLALAAGVAPENSALLPAELHNATTIALDLQILAESSGNVGVGEWFRTLDAAAAERAADPTFLAPERDDKVLAGANAAAVLGLVRWAQALNRRDGWAAAEKYWAAAEHTADYLYRVHFSSAHLARVSYAGQASEFEADLSDYVTLLRAFTALAAGQPEQPLHPAENWLARAREADALLQQRMRPNGALYQYSGQDAPAAILSQLVHPNCYAQPLDDTYPAAAAHYILSQRELATAAGQTWVEDESVKALVCFALTQQQQLAEYCHGLRAAALAVLDSYTNQVCTPGGECGPAGDAAF